MPWQFEPKKDACLSAKTTMSPLIDVINRWFLNGVTPADESQRILERKLEVGSWRNFFSCFCLLVSSLRRALGELKHLSTRRKIKQ